MNAPADAQQRLAGPGHLRPLLGSGTSLIAAETTGRICYGLELDPAYVDVIVTRWAAFTGEEPVLAETGDIFSAVREARSQTEA